MIGSAPLVLENPGGPHQLAFREAELFVDFCLCASHPNPDVVAEDMPEQSFSRIQLPLPLSPYLSLVSILRTRFSRSPTPLLERHFEFFWMMSI
jgi:hypothetical protein